MTVIQCYCTTCRRTVYAEAGDSPECPVCLSPVFVSPDEKPVEPRAPEKNGSSSKR